MSAIKIAFFDVDGTLVPAGSAPKIISALTIAALQKLQANGVKIVIATGRGPSTVPGFPPLKFDAFLTFNGSYCYDAAGNELYHHPMPTAVVQAVVANATRIGRPISAATIDDLVANGSDKDLEDYFAIAEGPVPVRSDFDVVIATQPVFQLMAGARPEERAEFVAGVPEAKIAAWWDRATDIVPADGGKGRGVRAVLAAYGLAPDQAIAFGDGGNDIEMLQVVGLGVAMGNASDEVKAHANAVCASVQEDGIYYFLSSNGYI